MQNINDLSKKQDKELVELLISGSQEAFGELYARYGKQLIYLCKQSVKNEADAEDIVHDVFLKLWETRHLLATVSSISGFLKAMAQNHATDKLRHFDVHSRFAQNILLNVKETTNETEDSITNNDYTGLLNELIDSLPPGQKEIFRLNRIDGYTYKEISEMLQMPVDNVRKQASRATKKIKDCAPVKNLLKQMSIHFLMITIIRALFL